MRHGPFTTGAAALCALVMGSTQVQAADCWNKDAVAAAQVRELHLMLMTVKLRCRIIHPGIAVSYDQFLSHQKRAISDAEEQLKDHFGKGRSSAGRGDFDRFHTDIANFYGIGKTDPQSCAMFDLVAKELSKTEATAATMLRIASDMVPEPRITGLKCATP